MGNYCDHYSAFIFEWIFFILVSNKVNYKSLLDGLELRQDPITDYGVTLGRWSCTHTKRSNAQLLGEYEFLRFFRFFCVRFTFHVK